jgi:hypothetical protein
MLLITTFVKLRLVARRIRTQAGLPQCRLWTVDVNPHMPCACRTHAALCRGLEKSLSERHGHGMARAQHVMRESNTAVLCKSNGKDTIQTLSGTAWQGNGVGAAWYV